MKTAPLEQAAISACGTPTLLCVDDDVDTLIAIELRLKPFDLNIVRASDGMEGFGEALEHKPDVILLDLDMPYADGMTILECLRSDAETESIPIIILTGMHDPTLKGRLLGMGANHFLRKPIQFDLLIQALSRFITLRERVHETTPFEDHDDDQAKNLGSG